MFTIKGKVVYRIKLNYGAICCDCSKPTDKITVIGFATDKDSDEPAEVYVCQQCAEKYKNTVGIVQR